VKHDGQVSVINEVRFTIPLAFPSVNSLHQIIYSQRRVELKPEVRKWRNDAKDYVPRMILRSDSLIHVDAVFHFKQRSQNKQLKRRDVHNAIKVILDVIAEKLGFDDCRVKSGSWDSVDAVSEKVEIVLREVMDGIPT
jgi:Holliday junction resolvase RusA-like endonuclease